MKTPNILIVMTDQQRADLRKGCGYSLDTMPFLDEWAKGGTDFARGYTPNPTCMPARVSMFTGRYSECHKARTNHNVADVSYTEDLLDVVKKAGYETALCGKNHSHHKPEEFDFHKTCGHLGYESEENTTTEQLEFADFLVGTRHMEMHQPSPGGVTVQHPYRNVSDALEFLDTRDATKPFFAWVSFAEPHNPYQVPEPYFDLFPPESLPPTAGTKDDLAGKGERFAWLRETWETVLGEDIENRILRARSNYHGMLRLIDDQFKRLIDGLRERDLEKDTIVLYLSDHGDFVGEYGLIRKGSDLPDILCHVPFIWRGPGIAAQGQIDSAYGNLVDILPTLCDYLGTDVPFGSQGKSLRPVLEHSADIPEHEFDCAYAESGFGGLYWTKEDALDLVTEGACAPDLKTFDCLNTWTQCGQVRALWKDGWHIQLDRDGNGYLYHTDEDPAELCNCWEKEEYRDVREKMLYALTVKMMQETDNLPAPHYRYRVKVHPKGYENQPCRSGDVGVRR